MATAYQIAELFLMASGSAALLALAYLFARAARNQ